MKGNRIRYSSVTLKLHFFCWVGAKAKIFRYRFVCSGDDVTQSGLFVGKYRRRAVAAAFFADAIDRTRRIAIRNPLWW